MTRAEHLAAVAERVASRERALLRPIAPPCRDCGPNGGMAAGGRWGRRCKPCYARVRAERPRRARKRACGCRPKGPHAGACPAAARRAGYLAALADLRRELAPVAVAAIALEGGAVAAAVRAVVTETIAKLEAGIQSDRAGGRT